MTEPRNDSTPEAVLDEIRDARGLSFEDRERRLDWLVQKFPAERLVSAVKGRLSDLSGSEAETVFRLIEAFGDESLYRDLANALLEQPDLPAERAWEALSLLDSAGVIEEWPGLLERWEDINEAIDGDTSLETLAAQLDEAADGPWIALQGLSAVEPEVRTEIIAGLAELPGSSGLIEFLRLLTFAHDPSTRWAAIAALEDRSLDEPLVIDAWRSVARTHPDPGIAQSAASKLGDDESTIGLAQKGESPQLIRSLVTAVDGEGRATIVLAAREGDRWAGAAFLCHVLYGVLDVIGQDGVGDRGLDEAFETLNEQSKYETLVSVPELASQLLAGSLSLCGPETTPALRYWIERTAGPDFRAHTGAGLFGDWLPDSITFDAIRQHARAVVRACPEWADTSEFTTDLALEISLREAGGAPDPKRDSGVYRYLFEHRFAGRIELYQRMLLWMAAFWRTSGMTELGQSALALAWQLSDAQHAVPSHPFFVELTTMSLEKAE